jgi:hypothetical protein
MGGLFGGGGGDQSGYKPGQQLSAEQVKGDERQHHRRRGRTILSTAELDRVGYNSPAAMGRAAPGKTQLGSG